MALTWQLVIEVAVCEFSANHHTIIYCNIYIHIYMARVKVEVHDKSTAVEHYYYCDTVTRYKYHQHKTTRTTHKQHNASNMTQPEQHDQYIKLAKSRAVKQTADLYDG